LFSKEKYEFYIRQTDSKILKFMSMLRAATLLNFKIRIYKNAFSQNPIYQFKEISKNLRSHCRKAGT